MIADYHTGLDPDPVPHDRTVTVTINRTKVATENPKCSDPFEDITVVVLFPLTGGLVEIIDSIDESGDPVELTPTEALLATSLAKAGVDETGR